MRYPRGGSPGEVRTGPTPPQAPAYSPEMLRGIVERAMKPNETGNVLKAVPGSPLGSTVAGNS